MTNDYLILVNVKTENDDITSFRKLEHEIKDHISDLIYSSKCDGNDFGTLDKKITDASIFIYSPFCEVSLLINDTIAMIEKYSFSEWKISISKKA